MQHQHEQSEQAQQYANQQPQTTLQEVDQLQNYEIQVEQKLMKQPLSQNSESQQQMSEVQKKLENQNQESVSSSQKKQAYQSKTQAMDSFEMKNKLSIKNSKIHSKKQNPPEKTPEQIKEEEEAELRLQKEQEIQRQLKVALESFKQLYLKTDCIWFFMQLFYFLYVIENICECIAIIICLSNYKTTCTEDLKEWNIVYLFFNIVDFTIYSLYINFRQQAYNDIRNDPLMQMRKLAECVKKQKLTPRLKAIKASSCITIFVFVMWGKDVKCDEHQIKELTGGLCVLFLAKTAFICLIQFMLLEVLGKRGLRMNEVLV